MTLILRLAYATPLGFTTEVARLFKRYSDALVGLSTFDRICNRGSSLGLVSSYAAGPYSDVMVLERP